MMEALAMKQPGIATRTFTRTFCPGSAGAIMSVSLPGHLSGHSVRMEWSLMRPDQKPVPAQHAAAETAERDVKRGQA